MPIYDANGSVFTEIGKVYDANGTTFTQIGKVYDNNGTANSLIYTADYEFFPSTYACNSANWSGSGGTFTLTSTYMTLYGSSGGSTRSLPGLAVDFSKYSKLYMTISAATSKTCHLEWRRTSDNTRMVHLELLKLAEASRVGTHTFNISGINDTCVFYLRGSGGQGCTITKIWFE